MQSRRALGKEVAKAQGDAKQELLVRTKQLAEDVKAAENEQRAADEQLT